MFETSAEVLGGLKKAFGDYEKKNERVALAEWRARLAAGWGRSGRRAGTLGGDVALNLDGNGQTSAGAKLGISANFRGDTGKVEKGRPARAALFIGCGQSLLRTKVPRPLSS